MAGAVLEGILVDEPIEVVRQLAGHFGWATGAGAIPQALNSLVGKAMDPLAQRGIGKVQRVGHRLEAVPVDDFAHGLSTAEDAGLLRLLEEDIQGGERLIGKVEFEGPHRGGLQEKLLRSGKWSLRVRIVVVSRKNYYKNSPGYIAHGSSYQNKIFSTQISLWLLIATHSGHSPSSDNLGLPALSYVDNHLLSTPSILDISIIGKVLA